MRQQQKQQQLHMSIAKSGLQACKYTYAHTYIYPASPKCSVRLKIKFKIRKFNTNLVLTFLYTYMYDLGIPLNQHFRIFESSNFHKCGNL